MSHYTTLRTRITERKHLVGALEQMGFKHIEVHDSPVPLVGYQGDTRVQKANVIIRRQYVGSASNDIGFRQNADGSFMALISDFDQSNGYGTSWLNEVTQRYAYLAATESLSAQGFHLVDEQTDEKGRIHLVLRRMA